MASDAKELEAIRFGFDQHSVMLRKIRQLVRSLEAHHVAKSQALDYMDGGLDRIERRASSMQRGA